MKKLSSIVFRFVVVVVAAWSGSSAAFARQVTAIVRVRAVTEDDSLGVIEDANVIVRDGRIEAIGPAATTPVPDDARVFDGLGRSLLPGLIDLHVHLDGGGTPRLDADPERAARRALWFGVTTVLDLNGADDRIFGVRERAAQSSPGLLPRIFASGAAFTCEGGHGTEGGFPGRRLAPGEDPGPILDLLIERRSDIVKVMIDAGGYAGIPARPTLADSDVARIIAASHERGLRVAVHAVDVARARAAVTAGADVLAHLPFVGDIDDSFVHLLAERKTVVTPTLATYAAMCGEYGPAELRSRETETEARHFFASRAPGLRDAMRRMAEAGVVLAAGSDAGMPSSPHGSSLISEVAEFVTAGIAPDVALRAATRTPAEFLGLRDECGRIAPGLAADLLLVDGNPTLRVADLARTVAVWRAGEPVARDELAAEIEAERRSLPFLERRRLLDFEGEPPPVHGLGEFLPQGESTPRAAVAVESVDGVDEHFLRLAGVLSDAPAAEVKGGVQIDISARLPEHGLSDFRALRFRARASGETRFRVMLEASAARDADHHGLSFVASETFEWIEVAFADFTQVGFGDRRPLDLTAIHALAFVTDPSASGAIRFDVDDVELVR